MELLKVYLNVKQAPLVAVQLSVRFPSPCYARIIDGILARVDQLRVP